MTDEDLSERKRLAALAESSLKFRRLCTDALDSLICEMILSNDAVMGREFTSVAGRRCQVMLVIGDEAVEYAQKHWNMPREIAGDEKDLDKKL